MTDRVAVYVGLDISFPEILKIAAGMGAHITSTDVSRTDTDRVVVLDADVAVLLADIDNRLRFVPDITAPEPTPQPQPQAAPVPKPEPKPETKRVADSQPATVKKTVPAKRTKTAQRDASQTHGDADATPKKKTKAKKTTARRKTRGANGGS